MLKKLKMTASVLAVSAMFLMPTAYAEQAAVTPVQEDENCIKAVMEFLGIDTEESKFGLGGSLFRKNGFEVQDGRLYHYTDSQLDVYQPGFVQIEDGVYHVSEEGSAIDSYPAGFAVVDGVLCHVSVTGSFFDSYPAGFVTIDGKLYHVSQDGYAIDQYAEGLQEIDGGMYYVMADGSYLTNGAVGHLTFGADGRYTSGNAVLDSYVDQALAECTNSGMTKAEKLRAAICMCGITVHILPVRIRQEARRTGQKKARCSCLNTKKATATALQASSFTWPVGWATMPM